MAVADFIHELLTINESAPPLYADSEGNDSTMTESTKPNQTNINLAELLELADTQAEQTAERKPNTARLYASGRINFADGGYIKTDTKYTAKIADSTLILYADESAKRKTNTKTDSTDILFNLSADLRKRNAYTQAVENSKQDGFKTFADYSVIKQELNGTDYFIIDLAEHAQADEQTDESDEQTDESADE